MKKYLLILATVIMFFGLIDFTWACPGGDPRDNGICDTVYVEIYPPDQWIAPTGSPPSLVRFPIYATHDVPSDLVDSIAGMVFALCYTHSNPATYCSLSGYWNKTAFSEPALARSIFRDLDSIQNWMLDLYEQDPSYAWANRILSLDGTSHFWLSLIPTTQPLMGAGSRMLLATMTFKLEDSMTIRIDTCYWPPGFAGVRFSRMDAVTYSPQDNMPYYMKIRVAEHGDANGDEVIDLADVRYMINYLFLSGPHPVRFEAGDANCDNDHGLQDVVFLINYLYRNGQAPPC